MWLGDKFCFFEDNFVFLERVRNYLELFGDKLFLELGKQGGWSKREDCFFLEVVIWIMVFQYVQRQNMGEWIEFRFWVQIDLLWLFDLGKLFYCIVLVCLIINMKIIFKLYKRGFLGIRIWFFNVIFLRKFLFRFIYCFIFIDSVGKRWGGCNFQCSWRVNVVKLNIYFFKKFGIGCVVQLEY